MVSASSVVTSGWMEMSFVVSTVRERQRQTQRERKIPPPSSSSFSSTTLCEFWLAQLFLSIVSSPVSFVSNWSPPSSTNHSSHRPPILLLAFPSVCSIRFPFVYGLSHSFISHFFYMPQPAQSFVFYVTYYNFIINCFFQFFVCFESPLFACLLCWAKYPSQSLPFKYQ